MIYFCAWNPETGLYELLSFKSPSLPSIEDPEQSESYWLPSWGLNPFVESEGLFDPEWN